jgi:hypothetical protein
MIKEINFVNKLWQEQSNAMEKSFKLEERKIIFVLALFGVGGYGYKFVGDIQNELIYLYYLVPLAAVAFDFLISSQKYAVRRVGAFLCLNSIYDLEYRWEEFVNVKRENHTLTGSDIFTSLSFIASFGLVIVQHYNKCVCISSQLVQLAMDCMWFGILIALAVYAKKRNLNELSKLKEESGIESHNKSAANKAN